MNNRELFLRHVAQTSPAPIGIEPAHASGIYIDDVQGKRYIDLISGFSVCNIGHGHPAVIQAVKDQVDKYMHVIVYGEFIEQPQVAYAQLLTRHLPPTLNTVYFTNSGAEATEGAMKLAKRVTGRTGIIAFHHAYHGSTQGALSVMGGEYWRNAFRPLLPGITHFPYNEDEVLDAIDESHACVILETVQAESGILAPRQQWLQALAARCREKGVLLILDEIQAGFGRTGTLWAFEQYGIVPDILLLGKALGGGMPLGAFIADSSLMQHLTHGPVLGHITTFGGHPVSCAAGMAAFNVLLEEHYLQTIPARMANFLNQLQHKAIKEIRHHGLWASLQFESDTVNQRIVHQCVKNGLITDWFLFAPDRLRFAPPLMITEEALQTVAVTIQRSIDEVLG
jgi:acetylornithine/succinyldiaminopimelate/putrescine aminotransferase